MLREPLMLCAASMLSVASLVAQPRSDAMPTDYTNPAHWLCRPGQTGACDVDLSTTVIAPDGRSTIETVPRASRAAIDCFYVYPTVSTDTTDLSDLVPDSAESTAVRLQFARFGQHCRLYAPVYRQGTIAGLRRRLAGGSTSNASEVAYADVLAAWREYLARDNRGRGVVLIGHSQGGRLLMELIRREIEGTPLQSRIVSAVLLGVGGEIRTPVGRDVGGTFTHMPLCRAISQTGCIIAYTSFRATAPPPANTLFGRSTESTMSVACTNPAALAGGSAPLASHFDAGGRTVIALGPPSRWTLRGTPLRTPFVQVQGLVSGQCVVHGALSYLEITVHRDATSVASRDLQGDLSPEWGTHLVDVELTLGDLVRVVGRQATAYLRQSRVR